MQIIMQLPVFQIFIVLQPVTSILDPPALIMEAYSKSFDLETSCLQAQQPVLVTRINWCPNSI
jgi:hypothetical protein